MPAMVSHQPTRGSDVRMSGPSSSPPPRGTAGKERKEGGSIYHSHPIPGMPPALLNRPRPSRDSMLAYSERMRQISKVRTDTVTTTGDVAAAADPSSPQTILEIQARHIPKTGQQRQSNTKPLQRRPLSLDELIGRRGKKDEAASTTSAETRRSDRCMSEPPPPRLVIPSLALSSSPRPADNTAQKEEKRIRINFVSTADLFDLVDFSLRSKKADNIQLARVDDTLRLINEANFFRSLSGRRRKKLPGMERESDVGTASLVVQGLSSPKESSRDSSSEVREDFKDGDWARKEMAGHMDPYDSDDEEDEDEGEDEDDGADWDSDLIQDRRKMLMLPQKLHFRPKRAKRMRLHRSQLSAIPEDEHAHHRPDHQPAASAQDFSVRIPPIPTMSSLTAIKRTKPLEPLTAPDTGVKKTLDRTDTINAQKGSIEEDCSPRSQPIHNKENRATKNTHHPKRHGNGAENGSLNGQPAESPHHDRAHMVKPDHEHSSRKKDTARRTLTGFRSSSLLPGRSVLADASDTHQKKIRKIVFLRDLPEGAPSYRSSQ